MQISFGFIGATIAAMRQPAGATRRRAAAMPSAPVNAADDDAPPRGCAWVVSSLELRRGLAVIEHDVIDVTALPTDWLADAMAA